MLKKIECFIQPSRLDGLRDALVEMGVGGMSVIEARGFGRQRGFSEGEKPADSVRFLPKTKLEIVVEEEQVEEVISLIQRNARTGAIGAGKIFVLPVEDAVRVSTSESGRRALD